MRVQIVLHDANKGGIIGKMAKRLAESTREFGIDATISNQPAADVDVNHFMMYYASQPVASTKNSMFITHVDDACKFGITKKLLESVDIGICMSRMTVRRLVDYGISEDALCYVTPAHDGLIQPRRMIIGLTTNLYEDGRKREDLLLRLGREVGFQDFQFEIFGEGWEKAIPELKCSGAAVNYHPPGSDYLHDYAQMVEAIPRFDYYLYLGLDEGSMGTLDALAAGVPLIVTKEGFHMDLGISVDHSFLEYSELKKIFQSILDKRNRRREAANKLTWREYGQSHVIIWKAICKNGRASVRKALDQNSVLEENIDGYRNRTLVDKVEDFTKIFDPARRGMAQGHYYSKWINTPKWKMKGWILKLLQISRESGWRAGLSYILTGTFEKIKN